MQTPRLVDRSIPVKSTTKKYAIVVFKSQSLFLNRNKVTTVMITLSSSPPTYAQMVGCIVSNRHRIRAHHILRLLLSDAARDDPVGVGGHLHVEEPDELASASRRLCDLGRSRRTYTTDASPRGRIVREAIATFRRHPLEICQAVNRLESEDLRRIFDLVPIGTLTTAVAQCCQSPDFQQELFKHEESILDSVFGPVIAPPRPCSTGERNRYIRSVGVHPPSGHLYASFRMRAFPGASVYKGGVRLDRIEWEGKSAAGRRVKLVVAKVGRTRCVIELDPKTEQWYYKENIARDATISIPPAYLVMAAVTKLVSWAECDLLTLEQLCLPASVNWMYKFFRGQRLVGGQIGLIAEYLGAQPRCIPNYEAASTTRKRRRSTFTSARKE